MRQCACVGLTEAVNKMSEFTNHICDPLSDVRDYKLFLDISHLSFIHELLAHKVRLIFHYLSYFQLRKQLKECKCLSVCLSVTLIFLSDFKSPFTTYEKKEIQQRTILKLLLPCNDVKTDSLKVYLTWQ